MGSRLSTSLPRPLLVLLALLALALTLFFARATVANNIWSLRFVDERWGSGQAAPVPPVTHPDAARWQAEYAGIQGQVIDAANRLSVLAATGDRFSRRSLGHMLAAQGDLDEAYGLWAELGDYNSVAMWAERLKASGNVDAQYQGLRIAYQLNPGLGTRPLALFLKQNQAIDEAIRVLRDSLGNKNPDHLKASWLRELASLQIQRGEWSDAEAAYQELLRLPGFQTAAYLDLADLAYRREGVFEAAAPYLERARATAPYEARPYYATGVLLSRDQRYGAADLWYREAVAKEAENQTYNFAYAHNARQAGEYAISIERYRDMLRRFPDNGEIYYRLAEVYQATNDLPSAQAAMEQAIRLSESPSIAYWLRAAAVAEQVGAREDAVAAYENALKLDDANRAAQQGLVRLGKALLPDQANE